MAFLADNCRSEVAGDVISGVAVDYVGMDVRATFGESGLKNDGIIGLFGRPDPFYASLLKQLATSYLPDCDPRMNLSREIPLEAV